MGEVFINYRTADSRSYAALLHTALSQEFGTDLVFLDSESIPAGADFPTHLLVRVRSASAVLAVIGPRWLAQRDGRRPIDDPADWVRRELVEAFAAGTLVIPVLVDGAEPPRAEQLPADIAALARCQYRRLRQRDKSGDLARIAADLRAADPRLAAAARSRRAAPLRGRLAGLSDPYRRRARVGPLLLAVLPALLLAALTLPTVPSLAQSAVLALTGGLPVLADQLGRVRGRRLEAELFRIWGGAPTTQLLRWTGPTSHARQERLRAGLRTWYGPLPSAAEEAADPCGSDEAYETAVAALRAAQRGPGSLVFEENCNYGFRRNMLGLRPYGILVSASMLAACVALWRTAYGPILLFTAAVDALLLWYWLRAVTPAWVAEAAWAYAERLLEIALLADGTGPDRQPQSSATGTVVEP